MNKRGTDLETISATNLAEIQYQFARAIRRMPDARANALLKSKKGLQKFFQDISKGLEIPLMNEETMLQIPILIRFFNEVLGLDKPEIAELTFPEHDVFKTFMIGGVSIDEDGIMEAYAKKWGINLYRWMEPAASKIDRKSEQKRPSGLYVFAHRGGDEPDQTHLGKSYDDAVAASMTFMNSKEYLLATGFHRFTKERFMDVKGWTRTSSLWSDGRLVCGDWDSGDSKLYLGRGSRGYGRHDRGPRELVFS